MTDEDDCSKDSGSTLKEASSATHRAALTLRLHQVMVEGNKLVVRLQRMGLKVEGIQVPTHHYSRASPVTISCAGTTNARLVGVAGGTCS
jgi:hypothetical protein